MVQVISSVLANLAAASAVLPDDGAFAGGPLVLLCSSAAAAVDPTSTKGHFRSAQALQALQKPGAALWFARQAMRLSAAAAGGEASGECTALAAALEQEALAAGQSERCSEEEAYVAVCEFAAAALAQLKSDTEADRRKEASVGNGGGSISAAPLAAAAAAAAAAEAKERGNAAFRSGAIAAAAEEYRAALRSLWRCDAAACTLQASAAARYEAGALPAACRDACAALMLGPEASRTYALLSVTLRRMGKLAPAQALLESLPEGLREDAMLGAIRGQLAADASRSAGENGQD